MLEHASVRTLLGLLPILALCLLWQYASASGLISHALAPPPSAIAIRLAELVCTSVFWENFGATAFRLFIGLTIAIGSGIVFGLWAAASIIGQRIVQPLVRVLAPIPKIALFPALMLTLGYADGSKIALVAIEAVFPVLLATYQGGRAVEPKLLWWARSAGVPRHMLPFQIMLPAALPSILVGIRLAVVIGCVVVFLAEMISSTDGLGHQLAMAARTFEVVDMFVPLVAISCLGLLSSAALAFLRNLTIGRQADAK